MVRQNGRRTRLGDPVGDSFSIEETAEALETAGGERGEDAIHVTVVA